MWHDFPYTDLNELNLDWFLKEFKAYYEKTIGQDEKIQSLDETVTQFTDFVTNYFNNLDVQQEINNKLNAMAADGTLLDLIRPYYDEIVSSQNQRISTLEGRVDNLAHLTEGSTTGDAELMDIRTGAQGEVYSSAGNAVRGQVDIINTAFNDTGICPASISGNNNTYVAFDTAFLIKANHKYKVVVATWSHDNVPSSSTATLLEDKYKVIDAYTTLHKYVTNETLPDSYEFVAPSNVPDNAYYSIGGRADSGTVGSVILIDMTEAELTGFNNKSSDIFAVYSRASNIFYRNTTNYALKPDSFYKINVIQWPRDDVPSVGAGTLFLFGWDVSGTTTDAYVMVQTDSGPVPEYLMYVPDDVIGGTFTFGGRVNVNEAGVVIISALDDEIIPAYVDTMIAGLKSDLALHQTSNSTSFAFITDIHVSNYDINKSVLWAMLMSKKAINAINKNAPIDMTILNGDYLNNSSSTTLSTVKHWYKALNTVFSDLDTIQFRGKGNHDINDINTDPAEQLGDEGFFDIFAKYTDLKEFRYRYGDMVKDYAYRDDINHKIRYIFLNTVDVPGTDEQHTIGIRNTQVNFMAEALHFDETDWAVVFISHHALQDNATLNPTHSTDGFLPANHGGTPVMGIINAFINKTSYMYESADIDYPYSVNVDYSNNQSNEVIAMISGHTHRDGIDVVNGYIMMSTPAAGLSVQSRDADDNAYSRSSHTATETSWDIVTIDRLNKILYADRYGAGLSRYSSYGS